MLRGGGGRACIDLFPVLVFVYFGLSCSLRALYVRDIVHIQVSGNLVLKGFVMACLALTWRW